MDTRETPRRRRAPAQPAENPAVQPVEKPAAQPAENPVVQPVEKPAAAPRATSRAKSSNSLVTVLCTIFIVLLLFYIGFYFYEQQQKPRPVQVDTVTTLRKILDINDLSTFQSVYNGIAIVNNESHPEKIDFYVSYEARVNAGIDMAQIEIDIDEENKQINVRLPAVKLMTPEVDIASLDYIFCENKANTATVSMRALNACIDDVTEESAGEKAILEFAHQNALNTVKALLGPFVDQMDASYQLNIK